MIATLRRTVKHSAPTLVTISIVGLAGGWVYAGSPKAVSPSQPRHLGSRSCASYGSEGSAAVWSANWVR